MEIKYLDTYRISDELEEMDLVQVTGLLTNAHWCKGISLEEVKKGTSNSALNIATYDSQNKIIGFSRVVSDKTRFAYLLDVFVHEDHRKKGIAKAMVNFALHHPELKDVYQWVLRTKDAHGVYSEIGFKPLAEMHEWMSIIHHRSR